MASLSLSRLIRLLTASLCWSRGRSANGDPRSGEGPQGSSTLALIMPSWTRPSGTDPSPLVDPLLQSLQSLWHFQIMALAFHLPSFRFESFHFIFTSLLSSPQFHQEGSCAVIPRQAPLGVKRRGTARLLV